MVVGPPYQLLHSIHLTDVGIIIKWGEHVISYHLKINGLSRSEMGFSPSGQLRLLSEEKPTYMLEILPELVGKSFLFHTMGGFLGLFNNLAYYEISKTTIKTITVTHNGNPYAVYPDPYISIDERFQKAHLVTIRYSISLPFCELYKFQKSARISSQKYWKIKGEDITLPITVDLENNEKLLQLVEKNKYIIEDAIITKSLPTKI